MLAFKRAGWGPNLAEFIAKVLDPSPRYSSGRRLMRSATGATFWGVDPPTEFENLVATLTGILNTWGAGSRDKIEAIVTARRKVAWIHVLCHCIEAEFAEFPWLSDSWRPSSPLTINLPSP